MKSKISYEKINPNSAVSNLNLNVTMLEPTLAFKSKTKVHDIMSHIKQ